MLPNVIPSGASVLPILVIPTEASVLPIRVIPTEASLLPIRAIPTEASVRAEWRALGCSFFGRDPSMSLARSLHSG